MDSQVLAVNLPEAARRLGISLRTVATLIAQGKLKTLRIGRRCLIPVFELERFVKRDHIVIAK